MNDIKRSVARGALWTLAANGGDRLLGIVSVSILARLLTPDDFGLIGLGFAAIAAVECLSAFGFDWALVRQPNLTAEHLNTGWTLRIIVNGVVAALVLVLAAPAAGYFHEPRLEGVIWVLAACKLVSGFENIGMVIFRRELRFEKEFQLLLATRLINLAVVLPVAFFFRSYWALLAGLVTSRIAAVAVSYMLQPFRPRFSVAAYRALISFSVWLQANGILLTIRSRAADFVLGRVVDARAVALFSMSSEIANLAVTEIAAPINRAVFSGYSTFSNDRDRLGDAYLSVAGIIWLVCLPIAAGIACTAPQVVLLFLGEQWLGAVPVLQMLALGGLATVMTANTQFVFMAIGRPAINTWVSLASVVLLVPVLILLTQWDGVRGAAIGYAAAMGAAVPLVFWWLHRAIGLSFARLARHSWRPVIGALAMVVVVVAIRPQELHIDFFVNVLDLAQLAGIGALVFVASVYVLWRISGRPRGAETQLIETAGAIVRRADTSTVRRPIPESR